MSEPVDPSRLPTPLEPDLEAVREETIQRLQEAGCTGDDIAPLRDCDVRVATILTNATLTERRIITAEQERIILEVADSVHAHAVILYGSRARDEATDTSDFDLFMVRAEGPAKRLVREISGIEIDAWVEPESSCDPEKDEGLMRLADGVLLRDKDGFGWRLLDKVSECFLRPRPEMSAENRSLMLSWVPKMVHRVQEGGPLADYRRAELLAALLPLYFEWRRHWYPGPKQAVREMESRDPDAYRLMVDALSLNAAPDAVGLWAMKVIEGGDSDAR